MRSAGLVAIPYDSGLLELLCNTQSCSKRITESIVDQLSKMRSLVRFLLLMYFCNIWLLWEGESVTCMNKFSHRLSNHSYIYIYTYTCNHNKSKTMNLARAVGRAGCKGWITASVEQLEKEEAAARGKEQKWDRCTAHVWSSKNQTILIYTYICIYSRNAGHVPSGFIVKLQPFQQGKISLKFVKSYP